MTVGAADYQDYTTWRGTPLFTGNNNVPIAGITSALFPIQNFNALHVNYEPLGDTQTLSLVYFADAAGSIQTGQQSFPTGQNVFTDCIVPALGDFVQVVVVNVGGGNTSAIINIEPCNQPVTGPVYSGTQNRQLEPLTSIAASGNLSGRLGNVSPGPCFIWFSPADATGKLDLRLTIQGSSVDSGFFIRRYTGPVADVAETVMLPDTPVGWNVVNNDAAGAHSFRMAIIPTV